MRLFNFIKNNYNLTRSVLNSYYDQNRILVNNEKKNLTYIIKDGDIVTVDGQVIENVSYSYYLYHKPKGLICTNDINNSYSFLKYINIDKKVYSVGRLDKDSHGLLILTNDGKYFAKLMNPDCHVEKEYIVKVKKPINEEFIAQIKKPILLDGKLTKEAKATLIDQLTFKIILVEGKYHQIRRMVKNLNNFVVDLMRIRIGDYHIDGLEEGKIKEIKI